MQIFIDFAGTRNQFKMPSGFHSFNGEIFMEVVEWFNLNYFENPNPTSESCRNAFGFPPVKARYLEETFTSVREFFERYGGVSLKWDLVGTEWVFNLVSPSAQGLLDEESKKIAA